MDNLFPGCGIWFSERQRNGEHKDVPAVVLWIEEGSPVVIVARGTSQAYDRGFSGDEALAYGPEDVVGKRLGLTLLTRFRKDDVKSISTEQIVKRCGQLPRGDWKKLMSLTEAHVEAVVRSVQEAVDPSKA